MASEIEEIKRQLMQESTGSQDSGSYEPKWEGDLEALHKQIKDLMAENARLGVEERELEKELARLEVQVKDKQKTGDELRAQIEDLKELSDPKVLEKKIAAQERQIQEQLDEKYKELQSYDQKIGFVDHKTAVARLKLKMMGIEDNADELLSLQKERDILEAKLIIQSQHEKELMQKIIDIKVRNKTMDPGVEALRNEVEKLNLQVAELEAKQKSLTGDSGVSIKEQLEMLTKQIQDMVSENDRLLAKIHAYQKSQKLGIDNKRIKDLVEAISAVDAANTQYNDEVGYLRENNAILRTRVKKMELEVNQLKAMKK